MRRELLLLREMIDAVERIRQVVGDLDAESLRDDDLRTESVLWNFTVLGEAAAQMPGDVKERHPDVGWAQPTCLRNRIVHGYWSVDVRLLHDVATHDLAELVDQLSAVLEAAESGSDV
ncbi:DUF86 domain-containing protein [Microbacterium sp. JB110]|nr:DUF86 domain-containing protein [Microbacterium sp. JB110]